MNLQCSYSNTINLKRILDTQLPDFSTTTTVQFGDLAKRFTMETFNTADTLDTSFVIGEQIIIQVNQSEPVESISFYIETCTVTVCSYSDQTNLETKQI